MALTDSEMKDARRNMLLRSLPESDWDRLHRHLEPIRLHLGQVLSESGTPLHHVYLPTSSTISLQYLTADGASSEIAAVGREGLIGMAVYLGGETTPTRAVVQSAGFAYRLSREVLEQEFTRGGSIKRLLLLYTQACLTLVSQTAVCNRHHSVDQQLSRWLLSSWDRSEATELQITHDLISKSLGVRREGVTEAAGRLQRSGIITSSRGRMTVLNRHRLEACSCECYDVVRREYFRLMGDAASLSRRPLSYAMSQPAFVRPLAIRPARLGIAICT